MTSTHPLEIITRGVPALREWWAKYQQATVYDPAIPRFHMTEFTIHLLNHVQDGQIPDFARVSQGIEEALGEADDDRWDAIGLSILESLYTDASDKGVDLHDLYGQLGPLAQAQWRDVYAYHNNGRQWPHAAA